jgi:hypothetical protein
VFLVHAAHLVNQIALAAFFWEGKCVAFAIYKLDSPVYKLSLFKGKLSKLEAKIRGRR